MLAPRVALNTVGRLWSWSLVTVLPPPALGCASCAARDERIAAQARELARQAAAIRELKADMLALADEVRQLRRKLGRNSGNSSMPPSADDLPARQAPVPKRERGNGGCKPGKQPGAPGSHLAWSEDPHEVVAHYPGGACACGADLAAAADLGAAASHQVVDVPLETAKRVQHDLHEVACACGLVHAFRHGVLLGLKEVRRVPGRKQQPCRELLECLRDRRDDVLRFTTDLRIPPTSNQAERDLRPAKT
jgi:hypothetical protein